MTAWPQIILAVNSDNAASVETALFAAGALSVIYHDSEDQPILEPAPGEVRLWDNISLVGLFDPSMAEDDIGIRCALAYGRGLPEHRFEALADQNWERSWMDDFKAMQFADKLWVCPSHREPPDPDAVNILLDPGMAFGTGTHATTAQCLSWLGNQSIKDLTVLDYGCGSGILAVAAVLLGARDVIGVDLDEQALLATKENARRNGLAGQIKTGYPEEISALMSEPQVDVLVANILFTPLMELAPQFAQLCKPDGRLVMSGVLMEQVDELILHYNQWFNFETPSHKDGWALLEAHRRIG